MEAVVRIFKTFATQDRTLAILGANGSYINMRFNSESIEDISHIKIRPRNPLADTMAGRAEIGQQLLNTGLIKQPSDYLRFLQTGELNEMTDEITSENDLIGAENEQMRMGNGVQALALDNHNAHLVHHKTLLNNPNQINVCHHLF